ncbi:MAG: hypothetical protein A2161_00110 [Candidatus Schekmanbacteria bacterium RBG_13_48_7]|uniref:Glycosyltransferase RgtA/B/C/D-like domain-containing protein n=1 Tax=Candidatus Schekmanbacteria bacterium RBG_13_48_7 TaxID=1817878 RepID=A0A1F7S3R7_9BACT|nr:MAG: hypothetical protein A2161_00110 [Candidatus Schekmanbacteria bacterium RBG_13_48_7]
MTLKSEKKFQTLFFLVLFFTILLRGFIILLLNPPWQNPDEPTHFECSLIWKNLLSGIVVDQEQATYERDILISMKHNKFWINLGYSSPEPVPSTFSNAPFIYLRPSQKNSPPLYYIFTGLIFNFFSFLTNLTDYLILGRIFSLLIFLILLLVIIKICTIFSINETAWIYGIIIFIGFHPGFTIISTAMNPDILVLLFFYLFIYFLCRLLCEKVSIISWIGLIISFFLCISTKRNILFISPLILWPLGSVALKKLKKGSSLPVILILLNICAIFFVIFVTATWFFPGLIFQIASGFNFLTNAAFYWKFGSPVHSSWWIIFSETLIKSFWISAGWMTYFLHGKYYYFFYGLTITSFLSILILNQRFSRYYDISNQKVLWILCAAILVLNLCVVYIFGITEGLAQGRYLYPSLLPIAIIVVSGLQVLSTLRWCNWIYPFALITYVIYSTISLFKLLLTSYYP